MVTIETSLIEAKKDERGRKIRSRAEREALLKAYRESGMTQRAFAEKERINYTTFTSWVQQFKPIRGTRIEFAEVAAAPRSSGMLLEAQLPGGIAVRGDAVELARLFKLLRC